MTAKYICVSLDLVSQKYLLKIANIRVNRPNKSLVYEIATDTYSVRGSPIYSTTTVVICNSENEFIQTIEQAKLMRML